MNNQSTLVVVSSILSACGPCYEKLPFKKAEGVQIEVGSFDQNDVWRVVSALAEFTDEPDLQDEFVAFPFSVILKSEQWHTNKNVTGTTNPDGSIWLLDFGFSNLLESSLAHELIHLRQLVHGEPLAHWPELFGSDEHSLEGRLETYLSEHDCGY